MKKLYMIISIMLLAMFAAVAQVPERFSYQAVVRNASNQLVTNAQVGVRVSILQGGATGSAVYSESHVATTNANGLITVSIGGGSVLHGSFAGIDWADGPYFLKTDIDPNGGNDYTITSVQQLLSVPYALYAKEAGNGFSGDYNDLTNRPQIPQIPADVSAFNNDVGYITMDSIPAIPTVPTNVSAFNNDAGYLTGFTETDPTVPAWAKEANKPAYDYSEIANTPTIPTVPTNVSAFTNDAGYLTGYTETDPQFNAWDKDYNDLINKPTIPTVPTNVSAFDNDAGYVTANDIPAYQVLSISNDTIYLSNGGYAVLPPGFDGDYNSLTNRPNLFSGSYNDLTDTPTIPTVPSNVSAFTNDAGYLTSFTEQQVLSISNDTLFLTGGSFVKLPAGFDGDYNSLTNKPELFSGDYNDLTNLPQIPQIPADVSAFNNDAGYLTDYTEIDPQFSAWDKDYNDLTNKPVLFDGDYNSLTNKPVLFDGDYNSLANTPPIPTVPSNVSAFNNDAGYITAVDVQQAANIPTNLSAFENDANYITVADIPEQVNADWDATSGAAQILNKPNLFSGNYNDLTNKPTLFDGNYNSLSNRPDLAAVATTGNYNDLDNRPQIPQIPADVSAFNNDAGYITNSGSNCDNTVNLCELMDRLAQLENMLNVLIVRTAGVTAVTENTFTVEGEVVNDGGATVTQRGFVYATTHNPTISNNRRNVGSGSGTFSTTITSLTAGTTYYVRAFATNVNGTVYGSEVAVTTTATIPTTDTPVDAQPCPGAPTVTDHEGNTYKTVQIGEQCWMAENLRTTTSPSTGTYLIPSAGAIYTFSGKQARWYNNDSASYAPLGCGLLYNWNAAVDTFNTQYGETSISTFSGNAVGVHFTGHRRGICPAGWHLPSDAEWTALTDYVSSQDHYVSELAASNNRNWIAKALASDTLWHNNTNTCAVGNNQASNNATGFGALPAGLYDRSYNLFGIYAYFWSSTQGSNTNAYYRYLNCNDADVYRINSNYTAYGYSVRCLRDGAVTDGETPVQPDTTSNPTTDTPVDAQPCPGAPTVTDHEGNTYNTVQIGEQCWMAENLRTTTSPSTGTYLIPSAGTTYTYSGKQARWYNDDSASYAPLGCGLLYNWNAAVDTFNTQYGETSISTFSGNAVVVHFTGHRRGICPAGWHLPSDAEWTALTDYVGSQDHYVSELATYNKRKWIAKALASDTLWHNNTNTCSVGNNRASNNATGFGALPTGFYDGGYRYSTLDTHFWSSTQNGNGLAYIRYLSCANANVGRSDNNDGYWGNSVRCLRD